MSIVKVENLTKVYGKGSAQVTIQGAATEVKGDSTLNLQASGTAALKAGIVNIN